MNKRRTHALALAHFTIANIAVAATLFFISCQQDKIMLSQETRSAIITDVRTTLDEYVSAVKEHGILAQLNYLDHSPDFFWIPPGYENPIHFDSVEAVIKLDAARFKFIVTSFDSLQIIPLSERLAIYTGQLRSITTDTLDHMVTTRLLETGVVIKRKDGWKLLSGQTSLLN